MRLASVGQTVVCFLGIAILVHALALPTLASAQDEGDLKRARESFIKGAKAAESGSWQEAERYFREAYEISGRESPLFNWALSLKELDRNREAAEQLDNLLRNHQPDAEMRDRARDTLDYLKNLLVVISLVNLERGTAYVIHIGEREVFDGGERPLEVFAEPGDIRVSVKAEGDSEPFVWERSVTRGKTQVVDVTMRELPPDEDDVEPMDDEDDEGGGLLSSPVFWLVTGAVLIAGAGVGTYFIVDSNADLKPESGNVLRLP